MTHIQNLNKKKKKKRMTGGKKNSKYFMKIQIYIFFKSVLLLLFACLLVKYKSITLQEQGRENNKILYILFQVVWRARKKKEKEV